MLDEHRQVAGADRVVYANVLRPAELTCELPRHRDAAERIHAVVRAA
ncbi:MAG TPA: hypothetical protein VLH79_00315 [Chthonomonadales bacterium]|nr:hypothetical protein [Chthonomonadales bacterium]